VFQASPRVFLQDRWNPKELVLMAQLGLNFPFYAGGPYTDMVALGREAEDAGYDCLLVHEGQASNDAMLNCHMLAAVTSRVRIMSNVVNIHLREPSLCASAAATIQQASGDRFILGIGISHRPVLGAMGIEMGNGRERLRDYTMALRRFSTGETAASFANYFPQPKKPVPIYFGAVTLQTARMAGELADGLALVLSTPERLGRMIRAARDNAIRHGRRPEEVAAACGVMTFIHDDLTTAREAARAGLAFFMFLPAYNRLLHNSGFEAEAAAVAAAWAKGDAAAATAAVPARLLDCAALYGPPARCRERIAALREISGLDMLSIVPYPVAGEDLLSAIRRCLIALAPR
jgi:alkanesulfonate monooxygenase SsuD/methylene tetrahydromethanopterin reductase-like flavin-dependent oxidoreductase (luciferase family)